MHKKPFLCVPLFDSVESPEGPSESPERPSTKNKTRRISNRRAADVDKKIGARLRLLRNARRITQAQVAEILDVTAQQVQKYENGKARISAARLQQLAKELGVDFEYFFSGTPRNETSDINKVLADLAKRDLRGGGLQIPRGFRSPRPLTDNRNLDPTTVVPVIEHVFRQFVRVVPLSVQVDLMSLMQTIIQYQSYLDQDNMIDPRSYRDNDLPPTP